MPFLVRELVCAQICTSPFLPCKTSPICMDILTMELILIQFTLGVVIWLHKDSPVATTNTAQITSWNLFLKLMGLFGLWSTKRLPCEHTGTKHPVCLKRPWPSHLHCLSGRRTQLGDSHVLISKLTAKLQWAWYQHKGRRADRWKTAGPQNKPSGIWSKGFWKGVRPFNVEWRLPNKWCWENWISPGKEWRLALT